MRVSTNYGAFHRPRLAAGVGMKTGTMIWVIPVSLGMLANSLWVIVLIALLSALAHATLAWAFSKDHKLFEAYAMYAQTSDHYDAGLSRNSSGLLMRPNGYGKNIQC